MHQSLPNTIDYLEMPSTDLTATKDFFAGFLDWSFRITGRTMPRSTTAG